MSRVRIEIWDNGDNVQQAEAEHIDPREAFERAVRMARAAIPEEKKGPLLDAGSYTFEMKNVQFTEVNRDLLFGGRDSGFDITVVSDEPLRKPCESPCADENCRERCARPLGHQGQHSSADNKCAWDRRTFKAPLCGQVCEFGNCWDGCSRPQGHDTAVECACIDAAHQPENAPQPRYCDKTDPECQRPNNHDGDCWCEPAHNESLCLNEIGAPSQTRTCHQPLGHEGFCDGQEGNEDA